MSETVLTPELREAIVRMVRFGDALKRNRWATDADHAALLEAVKVADWAMTDNDLELLRDAAGMDALDLGGPIDGRAH